MDGFCTYCKAKFKAKDDDALAAVGAAHMATCERHPLATARRIILDLMATAPPPPWHIPSPEYAEACQAASKFLGEYGIRV